MEQGSYVLARIQKCSNIFACFTYNKVYQISNILKNIDSSQKRQAPISKIIFNLSIEKIYFKIIRTKIINKNISKFLVEVWNSITNIRIEIEGKDSLQKLYKLVGYHSIVKGLQEVVISITHIGEGAFAQVYEVITSYQMRFAIKFFSKNTMDMNKKLQKSFCKEIQIMNKLKSKYIVSFDYIFETENKLSIKMQYFQKTLSSIIGQKRIVKKQKDIMRQLLLALLELKNKSIIHRDLKPDNIMIRKNQQGEEQCVLIDFGLSTFIDDIPYLYHRCGTPGFIAPQIANMSSTEAKQTCAADMFSLGCIFYKLLSGHHLFSAKKASQLLENNRKCKYKPSDLDKLSDQQKDLLIKMIRISPNSRITPEEALKHPYFDQDIDDNDQIPQQQCQVYKNIANIARQVEIKNMDDVNSSLGSVYQESITSDAYHRSDNRRFIVNDSCLEFQFGPKQKRVAQKNRPNRIRSQTQKKGIASRQSSFFTINKPDISIL